VNQLYTDHRENSAAGIVRNLTDVNVPIGQKVTVAPLFLVICELFELEFALLRCVSIYRFEDWLIFVKINAEIRLLS
jgi:hypothetical protein